MRPPWRRIFGLASRALLVTTQRYLDLWSIFCSIKRDGWAWPSVLLLSGLAVTSVLMAVTMQRHWSALRHSKPHGALVGIVTAVLQVAPLWEMLDKLLSHGRPRNYNYVPSGGPQQPLLQRESSQTRSLSTPRSYLPKGSPGENAMRGVRKMSMVNLPQAMLSLWMHAGALFPAGNYLPPQSIWQLGLAFGAAFFCVAFGIADFVLYIWVHDAFVRENKKLVTIHYCVEILSRVPVVVLFHVSYSRSHGYIPTLVLFTVDVLLTSLLLLVSRMSKPNGILASSRCCILGGITRRGLMQFLYSLIVSVQLFVVNLVYFDPGMLFFYVNKAFYGIKYAELFIMLHLIHVCRTCQPDLVLVDHLRVAFDVFWWGELFFAFVNAVFVWVYVPLRRGEKDARLTSSLSPGCSVTGVEERGESPGSGSPHAVDGGGPGRLLEHLEEIFELLLLISKASCNRNRSRLISTTVGELWLQALRWDSEYDDGWGGTVQITVSGPQCARTRSCRPNAAEELAIALLDGPSISTAGRRGFFDGMCVRWDDGEAWTRKGDPHGAGQAEAREVLRLILPQLALALRWDMPGAAAADAGLSGNAGPDDDTFGIDIEAGSGGESPGACGPLLSFLTQYALLTHQADFMCELYWALVCLSHDERQGRGTQEQRVAKGASASSAGRKVEARLQGYRMARLTLLRTLRGPQAHEPQLTGDGEEPMQFRRKVRRLLRGQRELWGQKMDLLDHLGHRGAPTAPSSGSNGSKGHAAAGVGRATGSGAWVQRTEDLRDALRRWPQLRPRRRSGLDEDGQLLLSPGDDLDERLLGTPRQDPHATNASSASSGSHASSVREQRSSAQCRTVADLVSPEDDTFLSLPIDPTVPFCGVVVEESEVMPSKWAPVLFSCRTSTNTVDTTGLPSTERAKYLLKVGDDLRQDQLMLQIMALMGCVWQERLPAADAQLLQLAKFRVLAVTPESGYVKFVPDAVPLSEVLHQSQGNLVAWLDRQRPPDLALDKVLDNLCGSVAACCVVTYILGIGDRHLENLCLTKRGQFFHIDFSFVLGDDPKPCAPQVRLPQQVAQALLNTGRLNQCFLLAERAYKELRPFAGLWGSVLQLTAAAGGAGCTKLAREPLAAVAGVHERLRVDQADENHAASEFLCLVRESSEGLASILMDKVHAAGLFWR